MKKTTLGLMMALTLAIALGAPVHAQLDFVTESFEASAGWTWGLPTEVVETGGTPASYLRTAGILDAALPKLRTSGASSLFVGDFRAARVRGVSVTLQIDAVNTPGGRELSVELANDRGTPGNVNDDCSAYLVGVENIPLPGEGWKNFVFHIPSRQETLPADWRLLSASGASCPGLTNDEAWNLVVTEVTELRFSYGDPSFFYIFQQWEGMALDNPAIAFAP